MPDKLREALEKSNHALKAVEEWASKDGENMPNLKVLIATNEAALAAEPQEQVRSCPMEINRWCEHCLTFHRFLPDLPQPATEQPSASQEFDARVWLEAHGCPGPSDALIKIANGCYAAGKREGQHGQ